MFQIGKEEDVTWPNEIVRHLKGLTSPGGTEYLNNKLLQCIISFPFSVHLILRQGNINRNPKKTLPHVEYKIYITKKLNEI